MKRLTQLTITLIVLALLIPFATVSAQEGETALELTLIVEAQSSSLTAGDEEGVYTLVLEDVEDSFYSIASFGFVQRGKIEELAAVWEQTEVPVVATFSTADFSIVMELSDPVYDAEADTLTLRATVSGVLAFDEEFNPEKDALPEAFEDVALFITANEDYMNALIESSMSLGTRAGVNWPYCTQYGDPASCTADPQCQWLYVPKGPQFCG